MKFSVQVLLPALSTLYFTLGNIWGFPYIEQIIGTIAAITVFFGVMLGLSNKAYQASDARYDGDVLYSFDEDGNIVYTLELDDDPADLFYKGEVLFNIKPNERYSE